MAENRSRIQVIVPNALHDRMLTNIPSGLRSGIFSLLLEKILDLVERDGPSALLALQEGKVQLTHR